MIKRSLTLYATVLGLSACGTPLPQPPAVWQCGYSVKFNKFRCLNFNTGEAINISREDARMEGAQCLNPDDYRKASAWVDVIIEFARKHCQ